MPNLLTHLNIGDQKTTINSIHYIAGTGSTAGTWLGTDSSINEYYDGLTIAYKIPIKGATTTTLNITGAGGTALGAKTVYRNGSSKITTHYGVGSVVLLVYTTDSSNVGSWQCVDYDSNTTYSSKAAASGGTDLSLVTTGEKYTWNNKQNAITTSNKLAASCISGLATVATSGSYNDLTNKPSIPSAVTEATVSGWGFTKNTGTVTGSSLTANKFVVGNGNSAIKISTMQPTTSSTSWSASSDVYVPTMKAISSYVTGLGYTKNAGTVTSVRVQAGTGLSSSVSTAQTGSLDTTISIASGYKLPTTTEWNGKQDKLVSGTSIKTINGTSLLGSGNISISAGSNYTLPTASSSVKGGIKVGTGLSISSEKLSVSYGTSSTTAAVGNDSRFGKVNISKMEYRDTGSPASDTKYYKFGFIDISTSGDSDIVGRTNAAITYSPGWYGSNQGYVHGSGLQVKSFSVSPTGDSNIFWSNNTSTGFGTDVIVTAGKVLKFNKINIPTRSGGSSYGTGSSGKVLKSNGTTVYWGDDNNTTYTFNGAVSTIKDSNLTKSRALVSNSNGKVGVSSVTSTELGYLSGVTSNIQTQLNAKGTSNLTIGTTSTTAAAGNHTHSNYLTKSTADARYALKSEIGGGGTTSVQILTRAEYNALTTISSDVLYIVRG